MNSDTCVVVRSDYPSTHPFAPAALSLTGTTDTTIKFANGTASTPAQVSIPLQTAKTGSSAPMDPNANPAVSGSNLGRPGLGYRGAAPFFSSGAFDGRPFLVMANFTAKVTCAAGGASVWTPKLWQGTNATPGSNNAILATTGISVPLSHVADCHCSIQAWLIWDSVSQQLDGVTEAITGAWDETAAGAITKVYNSRAAITSITALALSNLTFLTSIVITTTAPTSSSTTLNELSISAI